MKINYITGYLDGGTIRVETDEEIYFIDSRLQTKTKGKIYKGYPEPGNYNLVENQEKLKVEILKGLETYSGEEFKNFNWKDSIIKLLNS